MQVVLAIVAAALSHPHHSNDVEYRDLFKQLEEMLPTPTEARTASGAPGPAYWQQQVDYEIDVRIDDETQHLYGSESITYHNNSPHTLTYLWVQIDNNIFSPDADSVLIGAAPEMDAMTFRQLRRLMGRATFEGGVDITAVTDGDGDPLPHTIVKTMMRIDLPGPLESGETFVFGIDWDYQINDSDLVRARTACEYFEEDGNYLYEIAHWFPRLAAYSDAWGWHNKQFLGRGEFTLEFGNYRVNITMPEDHIVAATGVLQNPDEVLTPAQRDRLEQALTADAPVFVVTPDEAKQNESNHPTGLKTWSFYAENVRDFAFASSRKFIWDAWGHRVGENDVLAMSYYPNEGEPLWSRYSTHAIVHTLDVYSKYTFDYPYPVAISVNGPVGGMEYPMLCFNGPRPEEDGTYSKRTKYGLISVIIHEVGHNWFPMIVNSDERQWTWMDEGLNTFVQFLAEQEWEDKYPSRRGHPDNIVEYMTSENQVPIMTNSESIKQFGANAYAKPATALNILRETILGRELFDAAFKEYSTRWMFKRPMPADLFRSLEDASAVDLDWFWRGWFYTTDHVDIAISDVHHYVMETYDPDIDKGRDLAKREAEPTTVTDMLNESLPKRTHRYAELLDFYNEYDDLHVTPKDRREFDEFIADLEDWQRELLSLDTYFYVVDLHNVGGLPAPVIMAITLEDGSVMDLRIPAEIWAKEDHAVSKLVLTDQPIRSILLDPNREIADGDPLNNIFPREINELRFKPTPREEKQNPMQIERDEADRASKDQDAEEGQ